MSFGAGDGILLPGLTTLNSLDLWQIVACQADGKIVVVASASGGIQNDFVVLRYNANGSADITFDGDGKASADFGSTNDLAHAVAIQADGRIVVAGVSGSSFALARFNQDGSLDTTFDADGKLVTNFGSASANAYAIDIALDGKIVVAGDTRAGSNTDFAVARYNFDGSLDPTFDGDGRLVSDLGSNSDGARAIAVQADGKIVVGGAALPDGTNSQFVLMRYNADGTLDVTFDGDGKATTSFGTNDGLTSLVIQPDGKILAAGSSLQGSSYNGVVARYNGDGSLDASFDGDGKLSIPAGFNIRTWIALQGQGRIIVAGEDGAGSGIRARVTAYHGDGSLDTSFGTGGATLIPIAQYSITVPSGIAIGGNGKIVVATAPLGVASLNADGTLDTSFNAGKALTNVSATSFDEEANGVALQADGKIVTVGRAYNGDDYSLTVLRYTSIGTLDPSFDGDGMAIFELPGIDLSGQSVAIQSDGKILVAGVRNTATDRVVLLRYNSDGSLDPSFDTDGWVLLPLPGGSTFYPASVLAIQPDGMIIVASNDGSSSAVVRVKPNGTLDASFDGDGMATSPIGPVCNSMALQADGKIVLAGVFSGGSYSKFSLCRFNSNGSIDTTFDADGVVSTTIGTRGDYAFAVAIQPDGKILAAGQTASANLASDFAVVRYNPDGSLDSGFEGDGIVTTDFGMGNERAYAAAVLPNGKVIVAGNSPDCLFSSLTSHIAMARYNSDGSLDSSFDDDGKSIIGINPNAQARAMAVQANGRAVLAGAAYVSNYVQLVARVNGDNHSPVAVAGGPYLVVEGGTLALSAAGSSDPDDDPLTYSWDVNGDGVFGDATGVAPQLTWSQLNALDIDHEHLSATIKVRVDDGFFGVTTSAGTSLTLNPAPDAAGLARPTGVTGERRLTLYAEDANSADQAADFTFLIDWDGNGTTDHTVTGPSGVEVLHTFASAITVKVAARDQVGSTGPAAFFAIDPVEHSAIWTGTNGADSVVFNQTAPGTVQVQTLVLAGVPINQTIIVTGITSRILASGRGGVDILDANSVSNISVELRGGAGSDALKGGSAADLLMGDDPGLSKAQLGNDAIYGGAEDDVIFGDADGGEGASDALHGDDGNDVIHADGSEGSVGSGDLVLGGNGNDTIMADGAEGGPDQVDGGAGDDWIDTGKGSDIANAGDGNDILLGGDGGEGADDTLNGDAGRDIVIGGVGHDTIHGGAGEDIVLAGQLALASASINPAIMAIQSEWTSGRTYLQRAANILGVGSGPRNNGDNFLLATGPSPNILDDSNVDAVFGDADADWFLVSLSQDLTTDLVAGELVTALTP